MVQSPGISSRCTLLTLLPNLLGSRRSSQALVFSETLFPHPASSNGRSTEPLPSLPTSLVCVSLPERLWASWAWHPPVPHGHAWRRVKTSCYAVVAPSCHPWRREQYQRQNP